MFAMSKVLRVIRTGLVVRRLVVVLLVGGGFADTAQAVEGRGHPRNAARLGPVACPGRDNGRATERGRLLPDRYGSGGPWGRLVRTGPLA